MIDQIQALWPSLVPKHPQIVSTEPISKSRAHTVWKVTTSDGHHFVAKHHLFATHTQGKAYDLIHVECTVTSLLLNEGVSVPKIIATSPPHGLTIYPWYGNQTLDDLCQAQQQHTIATNILDELIHLEHALQKHTAQISAYTAPGSTHQEIQASFQKALSTLTDLLPHILPPNNNTPTSSNTHWDHIQSQLRNTPLTIGPTDYNARNILVSHTQKPYILELAKMGYDWPERRVVQYTTSLGAHLPTGQILGLLNPQEAKTYAQKSEGIRQISAQEILRTLDRHHLVFHLLAILQCVQAQNTPNHPWQNISTRLNDIRTALSTPLSDCPATSFIRAQFQT